MEYIGWLSTFFLTACAFPALVSALHTKKVGENWGLLILWFLGEVFRLGYSFNDIPILVNCLINIGMLLPIIVIKYKGEIK